MHKIQGHKKNLGEMVVNRLLPDQQVPMVGPWIFFDHMGPVDFAPGQGINVRPHPHIHLATVTYLFEGEIFHQDSLGHQQAIQPGAINLMVAGRGIVHSERERPEIRQTTHRQHGLQLWMALPTNQQTIEPAFYHYGADSLPNVAWHHCQARVLIGQAFGQQSPVKTFCQTLYVELRMEPQGLCPLPSHEQLAFYCVSGRIQCGQHSISAGEMLIMDNPQDIELISLDASHGVLIGGESLGPRYIEWNFVSSDRAAIDQAIDDWRQGRFGKVPNDSEEFIPY